MPKPVGRAQRYMPGLDGLRAIAVLAVIAYHLRLGWAQGGLLGVGVFFTLSGYLITDLLLGQRAATGNLRLGDFWIRRARRLLPALFLMLAVVVAWVTLLDRSQLPTLRGNVVAAVLYVSNWWNIFNQTSYFAHFGPPPPLDHLWSLAVEEQFYLIWPWFLWLGLRYVRGRYRLTGLTLALAVLSATAMWLLYRPGVDPTRVYEGTDTRAFGLLVGAALAMVWPSRRLSADPPLLRRRQIRKKRNLVLLLDVAGVVGLVVMALLIWQTNEYSPFLYRGGIVLLSLATALVVAAVAHPVGRLGRALGLGPLRWLGVRSYGIYLWHWPIIVLTTPTVQRELNLPLAALQVGATVAVAALSWRFVEEPIRRGALGRFWAQVRSGGWRQITVPRRGWAASVGAFGVLMLSGACLAGVVPAAPGLSSGPTGISAAGGGLPPPGKAHAEVKLTKRHASAAPHTPKTASAARTSCHAVAYIGDSTSEGMISPDYLPDPSDRLGAQYARVGVTSHMFDISGARSIVETLSAKQANGPAVARSMKAKGFEGCWVIALGTNDTADVYMGSQVGLTDRVKRMMVVIGKQPVLWVNMKSLLDSGPYSEANMQLWDRTLTRSCARYPNMRVFDWASEAKDNWFISDGIHYTSPGYKHRARLSAAALAHAFPASGKDDSSSCVVR